MLCSGFPGYVLALNDQKVKAVRGLLSPVHLGDCAQSPVGTSQLAAFPVWVLGGKSLASLGLASLGLANLCPGTGAELQDMFLLATHAITFSVAEQNKTQLWACSSLPRTLPQAAGAL